MRIRRERWCVVDARSYDGCQVLTLSGIGPTNGGRRQYAITPFDLVEPLETRARLRIVRATPWRRRCRSLLASVRRPGSLATAALSRIDLMPHQLEPALATVCGRGSRILLADEVGLGKTIQAGLIISELWARGAAERVLVLTPAGLREQWASELRERFGLAPAIVDMGEARRQSSQLAVGVNPWATFPLAIVSTDYAKRPEVFPAVHACRWDVVVVDEAHGVTPGSDRHHAIDALCGRAPYVVLVTATPHNGNRRAFESLCGLGAIAGRAHDRLLVFRRSRQAVALGAGRRVHRLLVRSSPEEIRMHHQLARVTTAVRAAERHRAVPEPHAWLTLAILHKRALSSAHSLHASVTRRQAALSSDRFDGHRQLPLPLDDSGGEHEVSDEAPSWTAPAFDDPDRETRMLARLATAARNASAGETKLAALTRLLSRLARLREPAIVFTEYRDTLAHVQRTLALASHGLGPAGVIHGGLTRDERREVLDAFRYQRVTILLATDAGGEGLNLHHSCRVVINLELPWNPMRLEQRIGRVDRIGQSRRVHAFNLIARDTGELRVFDHLRARLDIARHQIDVANPLESQVEETEETRVLRVVGARAAAELEPESTSHERSDRSVRAYDVAHWRDEAEVEHQRLARARALLSLNASRHPAAGPYRNLPLTTNLGKRNRGSWPARSVEIATASADTWLAFARHSRTRSRLAPDVLILLQSIVEDRWGRVLAMQVLPLFVRCAERVRRATARRVAIDLMRTLDAHLPAQSDDDARACHERFWDVRLARERAIAAILAQGDHGTVQPGLFDRRVEHDVDRETTLLTDALRRVASVEQGVLPGATRTHVALVLWP